MLFVLLAQATFAQYNTPDGSQSSPVQDCTQSQDESNCPTQAPANQDLQRPPTQSGQYGSPTQPGQYGSPTQPGQYGSPTQPDQYGLPQKNNGTYTDTEEFSGPANMRNQKFPLPAEPPTEFQKFAAAVTGQKLPIFGSSLFTRVPSTFSPLDLAPVPSDYIVGPGDELRIHVWGQITFQANLRADRSGDIFLPQIGPVHVAGIPFSGLDALMRKSIGRVYHNFDLSVDMGQIRAIQVYIAGQARRPGVYTVSSLSTLVDALFVGGGPSAQGSMRRIELRRGSEVVTSFDLYSLLIHGDKSKDAKLQSGDVIFIPAVGPQAAITGSVHNSAIYELSPNETLAGLLDDAGGTSSIASEARVSIQRVDNHADLHAMEVAYDATGLATPLVDGDVVHVFSIVAEYRKTVTIRGNLANPGRFSWHPGMRISELIPDRESLITRNYWWKRAELGLPVPEEAPTKEKERQQMQEQGQAQQQGQPQQQLLSASQRSSSSSLAAQQYEPNAQQSASAQSSGSTKKTEIREIAPEIDWDYAAIERLDPDTLKSTIIPFDLGKLVLQHDASQNLELQAGDVVTIFSEDDIQVPIARRTKRVTLNGEFAHAGMYTVQPGETFRELVERAGGFTPNAYLYGSEFTRESTRKMQQARMDEYVQSLAMEIDRSNLALAASPVNSAQDLASGSAAQSTEQQLIESLRQARATGRIVLRFTRNSSGTVTLPDITLEDGDKFIVPAVPSVVNVVGAVYDQNSFLYARSLRVGSYMKLAGGPNREADRKHAFVVRADGEVVSSEMTSGAFGNEFDKLPVYPGDTIVVPEKTFRPSALRSVLDWSQMFSQFALGAAAISVLK